MTAQAGSAAPLPSSSADAPDRRRIRKSMRAQRAALSAAERDSVARTIALHLDRALLLRPGRRIAVYIAVRGEVSLATDPQSPPAPLRALRTAGHELSPRQDALH